jgi:hypothetical protein
VHVALFMNVLIIIITEAGSAEQTERKLSSYLHILAGISPEEIKIKLRADNDNHLNYIFDTILDCNFCNFHGIESFWCNSGNIISREECQQLTSSTLWRFICASLAGGFEVKNTLQSLTCPFDGDSQKTDREIGLGHRNKD